MKNGRNYFQLRREDIHTFPEISIPISSRTWFTISWLSSSSSEPSKMSSSVSLTCGGRVIKQLLSNGFQVRFRFTFLEGGPTMCIYFVYN